MKVRASVDLSPQQLLRRHVGQSSNYSLRLAKTLRRGTRRDRMPQLRQPKVQNLQPSVACDPQVAGLEVTMNDPVFMGCDQAFRDLHAQAEDFLLRQRSGSHLLAECDSGDVLHDQE